MDPKEYAARLARMRDEIETAKAREQISNGYNKAMETSPMVDTAERLYAEFKAAKKPAKKKPAAKKEPQPASAVRPVLRLEHSDNLGMGDISPGGKAKMKAHAAAMDAYRASKMRDAGVTPGLGGMAGPDVSPETRARLRAYYAEEKALATPPPTPPAEKKPVVTAPAAQPRASDKPPDEELMEIERMSPEEAMAEWSQIASSTGVTGKKSPRDAAILEALRKKKSLYDDSNVKQAPATPYVPSWMGVKK